MNLVLLSGIILILGILFHNYLFPIFDFFLEILEVKKTAYITKLSVKINEDQLVIKKAQAEAVSSHVSAIGFQYTEPESEIDDFPDEEDKHTGRIGF